MVKLSNAEKILRDIRNKNERILADRKREIYSKFPEYKELEEKEKANGFALIKSIIGSEDINTIKAEGVRLLEEKNKILENAGYPKDYLEPIYDCHICKDTGADGSKMCSCKKRLVIAELYSMSGIEEITKFQNFDKFNLDLFREDKKHNETLSPRQLMEFYLPQAKSFAKNFPKTNEKNLYIYGSVGTGKTYMCNCIAKELLDRGIPVIYQTASSILNFIADYNFSDKSKKSELKDKYNYLENVELLIIDDLGTEISSSVADAHLFELINNRLISNKATIISSNLGPNDLRDSYDDRLYSRIVGNYKMINFFGDDLRTKKYR